MRSRLYMTGGEDDDPDARKIAVKKANYGAKGTEIAIRWIDHVFVIDEGPCMDGARGARGIGLSAKRSGAVMYSAFECGRLTAGPDVIR